MPLLTQDDAELVAASLAGNRDAFGQIVTRYQSLLCALAYSATGNLSQSEDLAQETFVTAWQHLRDLREPGKLRSWLCSIARNGVNGWLRRQGHEPSHAAESLDEIADAPAPQPLPREHTISNEEAPSSGARSNASRKIIASRWCFFIAKANPSSKPPRCWTCPKTR